jgi:hypothetical protein
MEPDFEVKIRKGLDEARLPIKKFASRNNMHNYQVMDPNVDLAQLDKRMAWGQDPVFPLPLTYTTKWHTASSWWRTRWARGGAQ